MTRFNHQNEEDRRKDMAGNSSFYSVPRGEPQAQPTTERNISDEDRERIREVRRVGGFYKPGDYKYIEADDNRQSEKTLYSPPLMAPRQREKNLIPQPLSQPATQMRGHRGSMSSESSTMSETSDTMATKDRLFARLIEDTEELRGDCLKFLEKFRQDVHDKLITGDETVLNATFQNLDWVSINVRIIHDALIESNEKFDKLVGADSKV